MPRATTDRSRLVLPILVTLAVTDAAGYSIIGPVLPAVHTTTGASVTVLSLLAACFPLAMLAGLLVAGRLAHADGQERHDGDDDLDREAHGRSLGPPR